MWDPVFCSSIPLINWKLYTEKYLPLILKMADMNHTIVTRRAAANILASSLNESAENHLPTKNLLNAFISLCQDTDMRMRKSMLKNYHILLNVLKDRYLEAQFFSEVLINVRIVNISYEGCKYDNIPFDYRDNNYTFKEF